MTREHADVVALLALAERSIALLNRCRPLNAAAEARRTRDLWQRGRPENPVWRYAAPPDFGPLCSELCRAAETLDGAGDPLSRLYAERARELELEASIAASVGTPRVFLLARQRYPLTQAARSDEARCWARLPLDATPAESVRSDAATLTGSLLNQMLVEVKRLRLSVSVVVAEELQSVAATGQDTVFIKPGVLLSPREARRIVVHELFGHVLPRHRARFATLGILRVGSAQGTDDEEGRALLLERRHGLLGPERQRELGRRHLAALSVLDGADWVETVRLLASLGTSAERAVAISNRVHRGGGLAREIVYLPRLYSVEHALAQEPELEAWLEAGCVSVAAARVLGREFPRVNPVRSVSGTGAALLPEFYE